MLTVQDFKAIISIKKKTNQQQTYPLTFLKKNSNQFFYCFMKHSNNCCISSSLAVSEMHGVNVMGKKCLAEEKFQNKKKQPVRLFKLLQSLTCLQNKTKTTTTTENNPCSHIQHIWANCSPSTGINNKTTWAAIHRHMGKQVRRLTSSPSQLKRSQVSGGQEDYQRPMELKACLCLTLVPRKFMEQIILNVIMWLTWDN